MERKTHRKPQVLSLAIVLASAALTLPADARADSFASGDIFISLHTGEVQWRGSDGTLKMVLVGTVPGKAEGMGFDAAGNLYVTHHCADDFCLLGDSVEKWTPNGTSAGQFGSGYNCNPSSIVFDNSAHAFAGQMDCSADTLKFDSTGSMMAAYDPAAEMRGAGWIDLARDTCTMFYTSEGPHVKQFNLCANQQLSDFNAVPFSSGESHGLRVLPDGGVLVAAGSAILRLDASGTLVQSCDVVGEPDTWLAVDLVGDGTFWATNWGSSDVVHFDMASGAVIFSFNANPLPYTVKAVAVKRAPTLVSKGRMTGGGSIFTDSGMRVTHGFELHCDPADNPNNLEVNWGPGDRFHLETLTFAECTDDPTIDPNPPAAPFDTYRGKGTGRYDNKPGATAEWKLTDAGEPGRNDTFSLTVRDANGTVVLTFQDKYLTYGNHQAHK